MKTFNKMITHDHDFGWERGDRYTSPHKAINEYVESHFPMRLHNVHAVINSHAQKTLKERFNRDAVNVPNVMDFDVPFGVQTEQNKNLHQSLGYREDDILLFQITRIVERKGIETAIELLHRLDDPKIKLVITGNYADDEGSKYYNRLVNQIQGAAVSSMSNIAEGFARQSNKEFVHFLFITKSSAAEVQSQLYVVLDQHYMTKETFREFYEHAEDVSKLTSCFIKYLKTTLNPN